MTTGTSGRAERADRPRIMVLRLNHRPGRDARVTTHVALAARTLGAGGMYLHGEDRGVVENIADVARRFGGDFTVEVREDWKVVMKEWNGTTVHLTMYGERLDDALPRIPRDRDLLLVVGSAKVPREAYDLAGFNVSVGSQPHSEVSAVALFMDRFLDRPDLYAQPPGGLEIIPQARGKRMEEDPGKRYPSRTECRSILAEAGCPPPVIEHCDAVADLALDIAGKRGQGSTLADDIDRDLLVAGAMLHDIGRSVTHGVGHIPEGVAMARELGLHPFIIRIIARHIGSGLDEGEARELGFPPDVYTPRSMEEKVVSLADSLISKDGPISLAAQQRNLRAQGLDHQAEKLERLFAEVGEALGRDLSRIIPEDGG